MSDNDGRVITNFIINAISNNSTDITIYGDGNQTRSFQYIDDLIPGMIKMMESDSNTTGNRLGNPNVE